MKRINRNIVFLCLVCLLLSLISCHDDKKEILAFAKSIVLNLNSGNSDQIKAAYPNAAVADSFISGINQDSIQIEFDRMTNGHRVILKKNVWFVVSSESSSSYKIVKSHGLFLHDRKKMLIAEKSGRISADISDVKIAKALADSTFFLYLANKTEERMKKYVYCDATYNYMNNLKYSVTVSVKNDTNKELHGADYDVKVWTLWMGDVDEIKIVNGKDISCNDSIFFPILLDHNGSGGTGFDSELVFHFDRLPTQVILDNYYDSNINDYKDYLKASM